MSPEPMHPDTTQAPNSPPRALHAAENATARINAHAAALDEMYARYVATKDHAYYIEYGRLLAGGDPKPTTVKRVDLFGTVVDTFQTEGELNGWHESQAPLFALAPPPMPTPANQGGLI